MMKGIALLTARKMKMMILNKVYVVVDEKTHKFRGVFPSMDAASSASMALIDRYGDNVLILPFDMYETNLMDKVITVEEIMNGKDK